MLMMTNMRYVFAFVVGCMSFLAFGLETAARCLDTYQSQVRTQPTGVYQIESNLYVHVRFPVRTHESSSRMKLKAVLTAKDLLRDWAFDYVAPSRATLTNQISPGVCLAVKVLNSANSRWRYGDWSIDVGGQEVTGRDGGSFYFGQIFPMTSVVERIPPSFKNAFPSEEQVLRALRSLVPVMAKANPARLYEECGILDLLNEKSAVGVARTEFDAVNQKIEDYLRTSARAKQFRERIEKLKFLDRQETWAEFSGTPEVKTDTTVVVTTNVIESARTATNCIERAQTPEEEAVGVAAQRLVKVQTRVSDEMEIVEVRTVTSISTTRRICRKTLKTVSGNPLFEELFLAGGKKSNRPCAQLASGAEIAKAYLDGSITGNELTQRLQKALCENPGDVLLWNMYGNCLLNEGDFLGALSCFRCALSIRRDDQFALANLMRVYRSLNCLSLSCGLAVLVAGTATDAWCLRNAENILFEN